MNDYRELIKWLQDDILKPAVIKNGDCVDTIIRVPYDDDFDFLYHQENYNGGSLAVNEHMSYCGIYNKLDGHIYDIKYPLKGNLKEIDSSKSLAELEQDFTKDVRSFIENIVGDDVNSLRSPFFENKHNEDRLDDFRRNYADSIVTNMFLSGKSINDVKFQCGYVPDRSDDARMLRYLKYHDATVEDAATEYWLNHQDDILLEMRKNVILREKFRAIESNPNHPLHKQRAIMGAVMASCAKNVNVTVVKGGEEYSFKYSSERLCRYSNSDYGTWEMSPKDRQGFENSFGKGSCFRPEDITEISFRGRTIYEADSIMPDENADENFSDDMETEDEGFSMSM